MEITYIQGDVSVWQKPHGYTFCMPGWALKALFAILISMPLGLACAASSQLRVVVSDTRGTPLADAVVTLRPTSAAARAGARDAPSGSRSRPSVPAEPIVIQQLDREFVPRVTVVPVGARVSLPNNDAVPHSVYSFSAAKQFEFDVYVGSSPQVLTLDKAGIITLGCNIHDWMVGYIVVVDAPFAQRTDARGRVSFATVPEGDYELRVWHSQQRTGDHVTSISLTEQDMSKAVALDVAAPRARYKPPLTLKRY